MSNHRPHPCIYFDMGSSPITRRRLLLGGLGLGATAVAAGAGMITDVLPGGPPLRRAIGMTGPDGTVPDVPAGPLTIERVRSAARGRDVDLVIMRPPGAGTEPQPICLVLHGRGGTARGFVDWGLPQVLTASAEKFTLVAVDCGESYFMRRDGDDPMRMLTEELPGWLGAAPETALGFSMGCFGALCLARRRGDLKAAAVASPALFRDWPEAKSRNAFSDEHQWQDNEPLRHLDQLGGTRIGVWCGTEDPFVDSARELISKAHPAVSAITRGDHNGGYWLRILPDMLRFVGSASSA